MTTIREKEAPDGVGRPRGGRDVFIDLIKAVEALGIVALHTAMDHIVPLPSGLPQVDVGWWLSYTWFTWVGGWFVPVFILLAGAMAARSLRKPRKGYLFDRMQRLLIPYALLAVVVVGIELLLNAGGVDACRDFGIKQAITWLVPYPHADCFGIARTPMWFLMVFIPLTLASPLFARVMRLPRGKWWFLGSLVVLTLVADLQFPTSPLVNADQLASYADAISAVQVVAFLVDLVAAWSLLYCIGFLYTDGWFERRKRTLPLIGAGSLAVWLVLINTINPDDAGRNVFPPHLAIVAFAFGIFTVLVSLRNPLERFAKLPRVRPKVDWLGQRTYSVYLWHMHCFVLAWAILAAIGLLPTIQGLPAPLTRLVYFAACLAVTIPVVALTSKAESWRLPLDRVRRVTLPGSRAT